MNVFSVYDSASKAYLQPFFLQTLGVAVRSFTDAVNDPKSMFYSHPSDYTLFHLGEFDEASASFNCFLTPVPLGTALQYMNPVVKPSISANDSGIDLGATSV